MTDRPLPQVTETNGNANHDRISDRISELRRVIWDGELLPIARAGELAQSRLIGTLAGWSGGGL